MKNDSYYMDMYYELRDDYNHLKSEKMELMRTVDTLKAEVERLKMEESKLLTLCETYEAEVERLRASSFVTAVPVEEYEKLKAELTNCKSEADYLKGKTDEPRA